MTTEPILCPRRIGQIVDIQPHPNADALYVEQINLGEDKPRQVQSRPAVVLGRGCS